MEKATISTMAKGTDELILLFGQDWTRCRQHFSCELQLQLNLIQGLDRPQLSIRLHQASSAAAAAGEFWRESV